MQYAVEGTHGEGEGSWLLLFLRTLCKTAAIILADIHWIIQ